MRKIITLILILVIYFAWGDIKVEKILETGNIEEYNQWVADNKTKHAVLRPIYIQIKLVKEAKRANSYEEIMAIERTFEPSINSHYVSEYMILYYDRNGKLKKTGNESGYLSVWPYTEFDYVRIVKHNHPIYPSRSKFYLRDRNGNLVFPVNIDMPYVKPTGIGLFVEYPITIQGGPRENQTTRIFSSEGTLMNTIQNFWTADEIYLSPDSQFLALSGLEKDTDTSTLVLISKDAEELWRLDFPTPFTVNFSSPNFITIGDKGEIYVYSTMGELVKKYRAFDSELNPLSLLTNDDKHLLVLLNSEIILYDNTSSQKLWELRISESSTIRNAYTTDDGKYTIIVYSSLNVYIVNNTLGQIAKTFNVSLPEKWYYKKVKEGNAIKLEKYRAPFGNWHCILVDCYLIFRARLDVFQADEQVIVYSINSK